MPGQICALRGCDKPPWPSVCQSDAPALACGILHHQLLMASRFNPALPHPSQTILDRNAVGRCALPSCEKAPCLGHSWCSKSHYQSWLRDFTSSLQLDQICKFRDCPRHVFVDDNGLPSQFCGWRHAQKFVMLSALQHRYEQEPLRSVEVSPQQPTLLASLNESKRGFFSSLNSGLHSLKQLALDKGPPENISVIEDFYKKHPWEVLTAEGHTLWFITCPEFTIQGRKLTTKGYHWKQSGRQEKKSEYTVKYYKYTQMQGNKNGADQQHAESSYTMKEYTVEGIQSHTLICLVKRKLSSKGKLGKDQRSNHRIADQVKNVGSKDTVTLSSCDYESFINDLPPLLDIIDLPLLDIIDLPPLDDDASRFASES